MNTPNPSPSAAALADFDQLQAAADGDPGIMRELVDLYFQQAAEIMTSLDAAIKAGSVADVNHLAHKLAGSSLACGMSAVVPSVRSLELGAKEGHLNGADGLYTDTANQLQLMRQHVEEYIRQLPTA